METLTIRVIRSFEYRTFKTVILKNVDPNLTVKKLKELVNHEIQTQSAFVPLRSALAKFDTIKIFTKAQGYKPNNLIINMESEDLILVDDKTLAECGVEHETELSYFNREEYEKFVANPEVKW
eukprot:TRINITY_DN3957_c0_g1_i1.p1 TRINITY_DN3957_c0_g1~~TRINITY_DN3957_c0_g1_i1.p1  ORF type:complete len:123 (-),score=28.61 TRINITY_DN3957_c0_g1_i1:81-449(-)